MEQMFSTPTILQNKKARLIPLQREHFEELKSIAFDESLWKYTITKIYTEDDLRNYIDIAIEEREKFQSYPFVIYDVSTGKIAGSTRFGNISPVHHRVEIGWTWYAPVFQRTGLNRACKFELLQFAFEKLNCIRVELKTGSLNMQSQTAIAKIGATKEGILRKHMIQEDGSFRDTVYFSILQDEWPFIKHDIFKEFAKEQDL